MRLKEKISARMGMKTSISEAMFLYLQKDAVPTDFRYLRVLFISDCSVEGETDRWISALSAVILKRELNVKDKLMIYRYIYVPTFI